MDPTKPKPRNSAPRLLASILVIVALVIAYRVIFRGRDAPLVVYCAHDSVYSERVLRQFEAETGMHLSVRYDTEATKSLGLVELLIRERNNPHCDVFWNNELLGTQELQQRDILEPYTGAGYARIPAAYKDPEGYWAGFGARLRVIIVNTNSIPPTPNAIQARLAGPLTRVAIAKPLYGTTLTHYTVLWQQMGPAALQAWDAGLHARGVREVTGNATVKNLVAEGACDLGYTDTDDFFDARDDGAPVAMVPVILATGQTIAIPNTVAIIRGTRQRQNARRLVDYLLAASNEVALANSPARQIPLGPVDELALPPEVQRLIPFVASAYPLASLADARDACLAWLRARP